MCPEQIKGRLPDETAEKCRSSGDLKKLPDRSVED
jgi:hypothetical protein